MRIRIFVHLLYNRNYRNFGCLVSQSQRLQQRGKSQHGRQIFPGHGLDVFLPVDFPRVVSLLQSPQFQQFLPSLRPRPRVSLSTVDCADLNVCDCLHLFQFLHEFVYVGMRHVKLIVEMSVEGLPSICGPHPVDLRVGPH